MVPVHCLSTFGFHRISIMAIRKTFACIWITATTPSRWQNASTLRISANGSMVNDLPLPHSNINSSNVLSYDSSVPIVNIRPFSNTFLFNFYFQQQKTGNCQDSAPINLQGGIVPSSYLDLRGLNHWTAMPNLELFANAGFPFTLASPTLSQTKIILPAQPAPEEVSLYLMLMAHYLQGT